MGICCPYIMLGFMLKCRCDCSRRLPSARRQHFRQARYEGEEEDCGGGRCNYFLLVDENMIEGEARESRFGRVRK